MPPDLTVEVPDDVIAALERRAAANGRSLEEEHWVILEEAFGNPEGFDSMYRSVWGHRAAALRRMTEGRDLTSSETIVRDMRDEA